MRWVTNATHEGRELHGHVVSGRGRVSLPRSGLAAAVPELPLGDRRGQRCNSPIAIAREPTPVLQRRHDHMYVSLGAYTTVFRLSITHPNDEQQNKITYSRSGY